MGNIKIVKLYYEIFKNNLFFFFLIHRMVTVILGIARHACEVFAAPKHPAEKMLAQCSLLAISAIQGSILHIWRLCFNFQRG